MTNEHEPTLEDLAAVERLTAGCGDHGEEHLLPKPVLAVDTSPTGEALDTMRQGVNTTIYRNYGSKEAHEHGIQGSNGEHTIK